MSKRLLRRLSVVAAVGAVAAVGFGIGAYASAPRVTTPTKGPYHVCVNGKTHQVTTIWGQNAHPSCAAGQQLFLWNGKGPKGDTGAQGPQGPQGPEGPQGPKGDPGDPATVTVTGVTAVADWPEGGGWATDNMTRTLVLTRQHAAESSKCSGTPQCWFYTGTIADNGTSTTVDGHASPNGSSNATIHGSFNATMVGGAHLEFYASSGDPDGTLVPATVEGSNAPATTSSWYKLAFPAGTSFAGASLTAYNWTYSYTPTCEQWVDSVNPGDDGQGSGDGNITGVNNCPPPGN